MCVNNNNNNCIRNLIVLKLKEENVCFNIRGERDEIQVSFEE
jgi:hypothetical protein